MTLEVADQPPPAAIPQETIDVPALDETATTGSTIAASTDLADPTNSNLLKPKPLTTQLADLPGLDLDETSDDVGHAGGAGNAPIGHAGDAGNAPVGHAGDAGNAPVGHAGDAGNAPVGHAGDAGNATHTA